MQKTSNRILLLEPVGVWVLLPFWLGEIKFLKKSTNRYETKKRKKSLGERERERVEAKRVTKGRVQSYPAAAAAAAAAAHSHFLLTFETSFDDSRSTFDWLRNPDGKITVNVFDWLQNRDGKRARILHIEMEHHTYGK
jgi:hypothetical protein